MVDYDVVSGEKTVHATHRLFHFVALFMAGLFVLGCGGGKQATPGSNTAAATGGGENEVTNELLYSAVSQLDVENLGISTDPESAISLINQAFVLSTEEMGEITEAASKTWSGLLTEEEQNFAAGQEFTSRDGLHLWDALLSRDLAYVASGSGETELEQANALFTFVVRNLSLADRHPSDLPLTLQEIWMAGHATAADRAWAFGSLLRQLDIDSVVLAPADGEDAATQPFLVGVLLEGKVYLYDPRLGIAIPSADGKSTATLSEVLAQPELLSALSVSDDRPYPITAEQLKTARVMLIGDSAYWALRMRELEKAFIGNDRVRLYDGLQDDADQPGLISRVVQAGGDVWDRESVSVWDYPESQLAGHASMSLSQLDALRTVKDSWKAGWQEEGDDFSRQDGYTSASQFAARLLQLTGDYQGAIKLYVQIGKTNRDFQKLQSGQVVPQLFPQQSEGIGFDEGDQAEKIRKMENTKRFADFENRPKAEKEAMLKGLAQYHANKIRQYRSAANDAAYWVGLCQFELDKIPASKNTFELYLKSYPAGSWTTASRYGIALGQAAEGDYAAAAETLAATPESDPAYDGHQVQSRLWKKRAEAAVDSEK